MSSLKPFRTDLAQWSAEYLQEQLAAHDIPTDLIPAFDTTGLIIERYQFLFLDIYHNQEYGACLTYSPAELVEAYEREALDALAHRFACWVKKQVEELRRKDGH